MRHHPLTILYRTYDYVKSSFFVILLLFILRKNSQYWLFSYGRYAYIIIFVLTIVYFIGSWFKETYTWENDHSFTIKKGLFVTKINTIPFSKIQNVTQRISIFHKIFGVTSLTFETAMSGEENHVTFKVISKEKAAQLTALIEQEREQERAHQAEDQLQYADDERSVEEPHQVVHYTPTRRDLWKASFISFSFLAIIPIVGSLYDDFKPFLPNFQVFKSTTSLIILLSLAAIGAVAFGIIRTFTRYGNYEISSSDTHIFIHRGILNESYFKIEKRKVQGIEMNQSPMKRLLGLAEVKLITSSGFVVSEEAVQVNSLYPFLPVEQALKLIEQLMPNYTIYQNMQRLPKISLWIKLARPSWGWIIATALLFNFKPTPFEHAWWILSLLLLVIVVVNRILDYRHTKYTIQGDQVQWWDGGLMSQMFITKRSKLIEVEYSQSSLQKKLKLASIITKNRSAPIRVDGIRDVPVSFLHAFDTWYKQRTDDVKIDDGSSA